MDLGISDKLKPVLAEVIEFIQTEVAPVEHEFFEEIDKGDRWTLTDRQTEIVETLKSKARAKNLENNGTQLSIDRFKNITTGFCIWLGYTTEVNGSLHGVAVEQEREAVRRAAEDGHLGALQRARRRLGEREPRGGRVRVAELGAGVGVRLRQALNRLSLGDGGLDARVGGGVGGGALGVGLDADDGLLGDLLPDVVVLHALLGDVHRDDLDAHGDNDVIGAGHHTLCRKVNCLLARTALAINGGGGD